MSNIPKGITRADVLRAVAELDAAEPHEFGESKGYDLVYEGRRYPPKAVLGLAAKRLIGHALGPYDFNSGEVSQGFRILRELGFSIERKSWSASPGDDWGIDEVRILVDEYFEMLRLEASGIPYSKAAHRRTVLARLPGRSEGSIEYKNQNVSAVLNDIGFPFIAGYKPARNYERLLLPEIVGQRLTSSQEDIELIENGFSLAPADPPRTESFCDAEVPPPDVGTDDYGGVPDQPRLARRYDYVLRDAANRKLGRAGEEFIVEYQRWFLRSANRNDLALRLEWTSEIVGDGKGYDVISFDPETERPIYIEVKTTNCGADFRFYVSAREAAVSAELGSNYRLMRVFDFSRAPKFYQIAGDLQTSFRLSPHTYEARR